MFTAVASDDTADEDSSGDGAAADMTGVSADDGDLYTFNIVDEDLDNIEQQTTQEVHIRTILCLVLYLADNSYIQYIRD